MWPFTRKTNVNPSREENVGTFEWLGLEPVSFFPKPSIITARPVAGKKVKYLNTILRWNDRLFKIISVSWSGNRTLVSLGVEDLGPTGRPSPKLAMSF